MHLQAAHFGPQAARQDFHHLPDLNGPAMQRSGHNRSLPGDRKNPVYRQRETWVFFGHFRLRQLVAQRVFERIYPLARHRRAE